MPFQLVKSNLISIKTDAIIYAEAQQVFKLFNFNPLLYDKRGREVLTSREKLGSISAGEAKIAPVVNLDTKHIIHTTSPIWHGGRYHETKLLRSCYKKSFQLAVEYACSSIALPIIATDKAGYPKQITQETALECIREFLQEHDIDVFLILPDKTGILLPGNQFSDVKTFINNNHIEAENNVGDLKEFEKTGNSLSQLLLDIMAKKGANISTLSHRANLPASLIIDILNDNINVIDKNTVIALSIALELTFDKMKHLLACAGYTMTHSSNFDLIIEYCITHGIYDIYMINPILFRFEEEQLGGK